MKVIYEIDIKEHIDSQYKKLIIREINSIREKR